MSEITETGLTSHSQAEHLAAFDSLVDLTTFVDTESIFATVMQSSLCASGMAARMLNNDRADL